MATASYFTGDTVRVQAAFRDLDEVLTDADASVEFTVYNADTRTIITTGTATRLSLGTYYYDYTFPDTEQAYILELSGDFGAFPQLKRIKVKTKFKV